MIRDVAGMGRSGFHQGKTIVDDRTELVKYVGVAQLKVISDVARCLSRLFETRASVTFVSDVDVIRSDNLAVHETIAG